MSYTSDAVWVLVHVFTTRWQHHSKLGCQFCTHESNTYTCTSDNKDACRCFHELYYTASALHEKETDTETGRWCLSFLGDCLRFLFECHCVWKSEKALAEEASSGQSGPLYISRRAVLDTIPLFSVWTFSNLCIPFIVPGGELDRDHHQPSHHLTHNFERKSFIY